MIIREPLVHATYYYLRQAPGDSPARRQILHDAFTADVHQMVQSVAGWLSMITPPLPDIPFWNLDAVDEIQPLAKPSHLQGKTNASAWVAAYTLRNMLLLRVVVTRQGEHEQALWSILDEALGPPPTTPSWLHTTHYWCGLAPRVPEDLEGNRLLPFNTPFGMLCLGQDTTPHILVYPDARTEARATNFLKTLAPQLDWHTTQARYCMEGYIEHATKVNHNQQQALDQVTRTLQSQRSGNGPDRRWSLAPLYEDLETLESLHTQVLDDLTTTRSAANQMRELIGGYRLKLMQSGLWDAAPTIWKAQVAKIAALHDEIQADVEHIHATLRRIETMLGVSQTRIALLQSERERGMFYVAIGLGLALIAMLLVDTDPWLMLLRVLVLGVIGAGAWASWRAWQRRSSRQQ